MGKIRPNWTPFPVFISGPLPETPEKSRFSVRVENTSYNGSVCQNTAYFDLTQWPPTALESRSILTHAFTHLTPEKAEKTQIWRSFFKRQVRKNEVFQVVERRKPVRGAGASAPGVHEACGAGRR